MFRLLATTLAATLLLAGCGAHPAAVHAKARHAQAVKARYLVFYISAARTSPAPAGAVHKFSEVTLVGSGGFPRTDDIAITATFEPASDKVEVRLKRDGKRLAAKDVGFYLVQFRNNLVMGGTLPPGAREAIDEVLKWAEPRRV